MSVVVGNAVDAARAVNGHGDLVGEGEFRVVRRIGEVVYKVGRTREEQAQHSEDMHLWAKEYEPNRFELEIADSARPRLPAALAIPEITHYVADGRTVNAMPFVEGMPMGECICVDLTDPDGDHAESHLPPDVLAAFHAAGVGDLQLGNVILGTDGVYYAVDCAW
jgi:hypothetical protein